MVTVHHYIKIALNRFGTSDDMVKTVTVEDLNAETLTMTTANKSFCKALCLVMMYQHIKFKSKEFGGYKDTEWTNK